MTNEDLSRLTIDRGSAATRTRKKRFPLAAWLAFAAMLVVLGFLYFRSGMAVEVESTTVTTAYPSQSFTLLNATGYVVAQRKAAVASKATGRVEWLGVTEGSKVTEGEIIARLENADVSAAMDQAAASVNVAKANQQAQARIGRRSKQRSTGMGSCSAKVFISPFAYDAVTARYHKAQAAFGVSTPRSP